MRGSQNRLEYAQREEYMNRTEQQAAGTHPAPCARHREANAFQIEIRGLKSHVAALEAERDNLQGQVEILGTAIQAASSAMAAAPIVSRYHRDAIEALREIQCAEAGGCK